MQLHWAPVYFRVEFKIILLTWRAFHRQAPGYIRGQLHPYVPGRSLRSYDQGLLMVPCTKLKTKGDRAFCSVAPRLWKSVPLDWTLVDSVVSYENQLQTYLFKCAVLLFMHCWIL